MLRDNLAGLIEPRLSSAEAHNLGGHPKRDKLGDALGQPSWPPSLLSDPSAKFSAANPGNRQKNKWPGLKVTTHVHDFRAVGPAQHKSHRTIDPQCLENPRPEGAESTLTKNVASPFSAEPRQSRGIGFQVSALDPSRYHVRIDPQSLSKTVGGVRAPFVLEFHSFQVEMDGGHGTGAPGSFQLETDSLIAHPCIPGQYRELGLAPGQLFRSR